MPRLRILLVVALSVVPSQAAMAQVQFERVGYRLTSIGERVAVVARARSARAGTQMRWRIADSSIATVSPTGIVASRRPGYTKLWVIVGDDSASTLIVVDQWAAKFEFVPSIVRFDAIGARMALRVRVRDAAGYVITDRNRAIIACRSVNERVAALTNGELNARAHGVTYVRCTDRGVADSVRVEVRPRAVRAQIADRLTIANKTVGDTFRIRLSAFDRMGDEIRDVQATWASLNPGIMSVNPSTGMARSVGPGSVKIVGQVGDATDTVSINVAPGLGMPMTTSTDTSTGFDALRVPTLTLSSLYLMVGDTGRITATAKDAAGNLISNPRLSFQAADSSIVGPVNTRSGQAWVGRRSGVTIIVVQYGSIIDSLQVSVRAKASIAPTVGSRTMATSFQRPRFDTVAANRIYKQRRDSAARAIQRASIVKSTTGRMLALSAVAGQAAHSARLTKLVSESRTGLLYGGNAAIAPFEWLMATADFRTGTLSTGKALGETMTLTEAEAQVIFSPAPWFGFGGGYVQRAERTDLATQRWTFPRVLAVARFPFVGGKVTSVTGLSVLPGATYSGYADSTGALVKPEPFSFAGEAGLEVRTGVLTAAVTYYVERFTFPVLAGESRRDQFSSLRVRVGLQAGR